MDLIGRGDEIEYDVIDGLIPQTRIWEKVTVVLGLDIIGFVYGDFSSDFIVSRGTVWIPFKHCVNYNALGWVRGKAFLVDKKQNDMVNIEMYWVAVKT